MKNKAIRIAVIWLLLAAAVFIYTDGDEYTWRYAQGELGEILQTADAAQQAEQDAQAAMREEQRKAQARTDAGIWGNPDMYGDAPETRSARDGEPGLNLMWGTYEVTVNYVSAQPLAVQIVAAGRQPFIEDGLSEFGAAPQGASASFTFTLTDSTERVMLACDVPEGGEITGITVKKSGSGVFSADLAAYAALLGGVLTWLALLAFDERPVGRARRRDALILVFAAAFASLPCMMSVICDGHDLFFHLNRIEGIAGALRCGQFPARIHTSTLLGYGYAAPQFYPELFLYIPALLRCMGVSVMASVQVFMMLINLATALVCYRSARRIFADRGIALLSTVLYTLSIYRLVNVYTRAAFGEALAMIFFPLLIEAMIEVLTRDEKHWPLLALGMTAVFMSHMLSTMFAVGLCALAAVCCLPRLVREPRRILACVKAAGLTVLCSLGFVAPFLSYSTEGISTSVVMQAYQYVQSIGTLMIPFSGGYGETTKVGRALADTAGNHPGAVLLIGCALLLVARYAQGKAFYAPEQEGKDRRTAVRLLALGVFTLLCSTDFFPWKRLCGLPSPYSTLFMQIQFPWRLIGTASPFLCLAAANGFMADARWRRAGACLAAALCVVFAGYTMTDFASQEPILDQQGYLDSRIVQYEYTYVGTEKDALMVGDIVSGEGEHEITAYEKHGTNLSFTAEGYMNYAEVPLLYYPGYKATVNGEACRVARGDNNVVRLYGPFTGETNEVRVWFEEPLSWRAAEAASLAGALLLAWLLTRRRKAA